MQGQRPGCKPKGYYVKEHYARYNPLKYTDPTGHAAKEDSGRSGNSCITHDMGMAYCSNVNSPSISKKPEQTKPLLPELPQQYNPGPEWEPSMPARNSNLDLNPQHPDYLALQVNVLIIAGSLTRDRYGNVYFALGANGGSSIIEGASAAVVSGWVEDPFGSDFPTETQSEEFLQGPAVTVSGGVVGGGGITWSPWAVGSGDAFSSDHFSYEAGAYTPQAGISAIWGFMLFNKR